MTNPSLVPTPIVDKNGKRTTVLKRVLSSPLSGRLPPPSFNNKSPEEMRTRLFKTFVSNSSLSASTKKQLINKASLLSEPAVEALKRVIAQPDPHGYFDKVLSERLTIPVAVIAGWAENQDKYFHATAEVSHRMGGKLSYNINYVIDGMSAHDNSGYTIEQLQRIATTTELICAVAANNGTDASSIVDHRSLAPGQESCTFIHSHPIKELLTSDKETADRLMKIVEEEKIVDEVQLVYRMTGGARALIDGVI